ncbi:MAG: 40S ribosomal protein [Marteilia pararefringens]
MGVTRDGHSKRRATGAKGFSNGRKKKCHLARPQSNTKIGVTKIKNVKCRGNVSKRRALSLNVGNFSLSSSAMTKKTAIHIVRYHPTSNVYVRSNILTKHSIVEIDAQPFKMSLQSKKLSSVKLDAHVDKQLQSGQNRLLARITSRPGQCGRADGIILEGQEFEFYNKKISKTGK